MHRITRIKGRAVPVVGDDMDTDRIVPARFLKEITFARMGEYPFLDERIHPDGTPKDHPFNEPRFQGASILVANANFGCGSSREHAPQALHRWGIRVLVGESFAEIFSGNCLMLGVPTLAAGKRDIAGLQARAKENPSAEWAADLEAMTLSGAGMTVAVRLPESVRNCLMEGKWDNTSLLMANASLVAAVEARRH